jgi:hypothetical protein
LIHVVGTARVEINQVPGRSPGTNAAELETRKALIEAARQNGDLVDALRGTLDWLDVQSREEMTKPDNLDEDSIVASVRSSDTKRTVRRTRWAQGLIADLFAQADAATRPQLDTLMLERRQQAFDSPDAFALQSLSDRLSCLPLGRELRMQLSGRTGSGVGYLKTSLALREIAQGSDRTAAAQAWYRLALLHDFRSEPLDAADC